MKLQNHCEARKKLMFCLFSHLISSRKAIFVRYILTEEQMGTCSRIIVRSWNALSEHSSTAIYPLAHQGTTAPWCALWYMCSRTLEKKKHSWYPFVLQICLTNCAALLTNTDSLAASLEQRHKNVIITAYTLRWVLGINKDSCLQMWAESWLYLGQNPPNSQRYRSLTGSWNIFIYSSGMAVLFLSYL